MTKGKRGQFYDDDDIDDGYDDEDYYDDVDEYGGKDSPAVSTGKKQVPAAMAGRGGPTQQQQQLQQQQRKGASAAAHAPARTAGASKLAQSLCDPPPPGPGGKTQRGAKSDPAAKALQQPAFPVAPHLVTTAQQQRAAGRAPAAALAVTTNAVAATAVPIVSNSVVEPFQFDTPSPDDVVRGAQERRGAMIPPPQAASSPASSLPQNKTFLRPSPMMQQQQQLLQQQQQQQPRPPVQQLVGAEAAAVGVASLNLGHIDSTASGSVASHGTGTRHHHDHMHNAHGPDPGSLTGGHQEHSTGVLHGLHTRRPVKEYVMEAALAREVEAAAAAETAAVVGPEASTTSPPDHPDDRRKPLHLVVLGHVDAGKSSLMGRLLYEVGVVSAREAHKYKRDAAAAGKGSFAWAWVLDERPEERERGVTVDVAMSRFITRRFNVTLLDAPGHRDFVPNMIAGAAQADAALLLVDGSPGGFEAGFSEGTGGLHGTPGGQTREHAALARSLGIEQVAVVVSKLDTVGYDKGRFDAIRGMLLPYLKTVGFKESALQWLPASGPLGENLVQSPHDPALAKWWSSGPCLLDAIDNFIPRERATFRPLRMPITDIFKSKTGAVVLGGKLEGGALRPGSKVTLVPGPGHPFTVRSCEVSGNPCELARAGDSCEVVLGAGHGAGGGAGFMEPSSVAPGVVLCNPDFPAVLVTRFELRLVVLDVPVPLLRGHAVTLHAHAAREEGHISALTATLDPRTGEVVKARPRCLTRGQIALVEVTSSRALVLEQYSEYQALGRVALREGGRTLAVGIVTRLLE